MAHNTAQHAVKMFEGCLNDFNIEELLVDIYYHFDYLSKRKNLLSEFCDFCDQKYHKILKFHNIRWLGLCTCIERTLKLYTSLSSYFRSRNLEMQEGEKAVSRLNRLIDAFSSPLTEVYCMFLDGVLPALTNLNLLLQRSDPIVHIMYDALFSTTCTLLSRFVKADIIQCYKNGSLSNKKLLEEVDNPDNYLDQNKLFVSFLAKSTIRKLLDEGDISQMQYDKFFYACLQFHKGAFLDTIKWFPLQDKLLMEARFLNFIDHKCSFVDVHSLCVRLQKYVSFSKTQINELEEEFLLLQSITLDDFLPHEREEAAIRTNEKGDQITYRIDVLWYYLYQLKIPGTNKSKFENLFHLAKIVLCIVHSNAEEESLFSRVKKNLTPQRASLSLDGTLSSIMCFQLNRPQNETCYQHVPSQNVLKRSKEVTWEYNKEHMSKK